MISVKERLSRVASRFPGGYPLNHCMVASVVLSRLGRKLTKIGLEYQDDNSWPFHIIVLGRGGKSISLYCGGFSRAIDIQLLKRDGSPDRRFEEVRYLTPAGAANYIQRRYR